MFEIEPYKPGRSKFWRLRNDARVQPQPWRWPLARLGDRDPVVLAEDVNGNRFAADLGYEDRPFDRELYVPVYAVQDGEITCATETASGFAISIDHGDRGWVTHYAQMSRMFVSPYYGQRNRKYQRVRGGDVIGYAAKSPIAVRFELWQWTDDRGFVAVAPVAQLADWVAPLARPNAIPDKQAA